MKALDPRTRLLAGFAAMAAVFLAKHDGVIVAQGGILVLVIALAGHLRPWLRSMRLLAPMLGLVFAIGMISFDLETAILLAVRLFNLLLVSFALFRGVSIDELAGALRASGVPYQVVFILTTGMRYVPLMGAKVSNITAAQQARGIDLRLRLRNSKNLLALLMPLLAQSFLLAEDLALAMESRGFSRQQRSYRRQYHLRPQDYVVIVAVVLTLFLFGWWERRG